jgi:prepilin-type N-terminal cleavage/methylation domain-containing protein
MRLTKKGFTLVELMVVIVIVGILAAVAIPKFTMASHKAKASEFPTVLMQCYTAEIAYEAEAGVFSDITTIGVSYSPSKWFTYAISATDWASEFTATATVAGSGFGDCNGGETATINQAGARTAHANLQKYATNWQ